MFQFLGNTRRGGHKKTLSLTLDVQSKTGEEVQSLLRDLQIFLSFVGKSFLDFEGGLGVLDP